MEIAGSHVSAHVVRSRGGSVPSPEDFFLAVDALRRERYASPPPPNGDDPCEPSFVPCTRGSSGLWARRAPRFPTIRGVFWNCTWTEGSGALVRCFWWRSSPTLGEGSGSSPGPTRTHVVFVFVYSILCCNDMQALRLLSSAEPFFRSECRVSSCIVYTELARRAPTTVLADLRAALLARRALTTVLAD